MQHKQQKKDVEGEPAGDFLEKNGHYIVDNAHMLQTNYQQQLLEK